jgi:tripartite-type tricarboxylate transporter receptor subunit TctC
LNQMAGTTLTHVPFPGAGPAMGAVVGNHVPLAFLSLASAVPQIKSGALQPIALTTARRFPTHPDIPTIAEQGYPSFNISSWYGVLGPAKMPAEVVAKLNADIVRVLKEPEVRDKLLELGADPVGSSAAEFAAFVSTEIGRYRDLAQRAGIQPQ